MMQGHSTAVADCDVIEQYCVVLMMSIKISYSGGRELYYHPTLSITFEIVQSHIHNHVYDPIHLFPPSTVKSKLTPPPLA